MNAAGLVLVGCRNNLDDFIPRELKERDVRRGAVHKVRIKNTENRFVGNNKQVVLFALKFKDDGFEADGEVVVGLRTSVSWAVNYERLGLPLRKGSL